MTNNQARCDMIIELYIYIYIHIIEVWIRIYVRAYNTYDRSNNNKVHIYYFSRTINKGRKNIINISIFPD